MRSAGHGHPFDGRSRSVYRLPGKRFRSFSDSYPPAHLVPVLDGARQGPRRVDLKGKPLIVLWPSYHSPNKQAVASAETPCALPEPQRYIVLEQLTSLGRPTLSWGKGKPFEG